MTVLASANFGGVTNKTLTRLKVMARKRDFMTSLPSLVYVPSNRSLEAAQR
jgi:hypothetical protein